MQLNDYVVNVQVFHPTRQYPRYIIDFLTTIVLFYKMSGFVKFETFKHSLFTQATPD